MPFGLSLHSEQKQAVCDAMVPIATHSGEEIIKEGLVGDFFYVVFSGTYSAYKKGRTAPLKQYSKGESFGELALLFTQPRQATILCDTSGTLYAIDRKTFKRVVAENALKGKTPKSEEQQMLQAMTANINLSKLSLVQQKKVCALMEKRQVAVGETVIREGDVGDYFYAGR
jgi:cAMP-dependent protein kinase regulator